PERRTGTARPGRVDRSDRPCRPSRPTRPSGTRGAPMSTTDANNVDLIVVDRTDLDEVAHEIDQQSKVLFTWDYTRSRPGLVQLYEKAKTSQWNATTDLPWDIDVDNERLAAEFGGANARFNLLEQQADSPLAAWGEKEWRQFGIEMQTWLLSQFLH